MALRSSPGSRSHDPGRHERHRQAIERFASPAPLRGRSHPSRHDRHDALHQRAGGGEAADAHSGLLASTYRRPRPCRHSSTGRRGCVRRSRARSTLRTAATSSTAARSLRSTLTSWSSTRPIWRPTAYARSRSPQSSAR